MSQSQAETRRQQNVAKRSMTKEAQQLAGLIAGLRKSLEAIHKERTSTKLSGAEMGLLDERRNNLLLTIAALDDRLSAVQGLINLGRPTLFACISADPARQDRLRCRWHEACPYRLRMASNCHAPGELPPKPAVTRRLGAGRR